MLVAVQLIVKPVLDTATVVGVAGFDGFAAALTYASLDPRPYPIKLKASTLKV